MCKKKSWFNRISLVFWGVFTGKFLTIRHAGKKEFWQVL